MQLKSKSFSFHLGKCIWKCLVLFIFAKYLPFLSNSHCISSELSDTDRDLSWAPLQYKDHLCCCRIPSIMIRWLCDGLIVSLQHCLGVMLLLIGRAIRIFIPLTHHQSLGWPYTKTLQRHHMSVMASEITGNSFNKLLRLTSKKTPKPVSLAFLCRVHRGMVVSPHKEPVMWKALPSNDVISWFCSADIICSGWRHSTAFR